MDKQNVMMTDDLHVPVMMDTHATAADEDDEEALDNAGHANDPDETDEQDDAKDVLDAGEVDSEYGAQLLSTRNNKRFNAISPISPSPLHSF